MRRGDTIVETASKTQGNPAEYDPVRGRYITDAFGDEAAAFINNHANDPDPFFLYMPMTAPHTPGEAKQSDLAHFSHITDPTRRTLAAMVYAMDRSVGKVMSALEANQIAENTIVVFLNDQGGPNINDNRPFKGGKGLTWEGGVRVPFLVSMPGLQPGVYDAPVSGLDLLPTVYAAAGGDVNQLETDGVNLQPYLSGSVTERPHETLFFRNLSQWGVRKGDWKLGNPGGSTGTVLFNIATDQGETTNVAAQNPEVVTDLIREFTDWEVQLDKPKWGFPSLTPYSHYVYRSEFLPTNVNV
jgi:arylsulfatase A-like enzyme